MKISDAEKLREGFTKGREPELDFVKENPKAERRERMDSRLKDMVSRQGKACLENRQGPQGSHLDGAPSGTHGMLCDRAVLFATNVY